MTDTATRRETASEKAKNEAEASAATALATKHQAEARKALAEAEQTELGLEAARRTWAEMQSGDEYHHVYNFHEAVGAGSVDKCIKHLSRWVRMADPGAKLNMELVFNSPGGSVIDGMALWDFLKTLQADGHHITTVCRGMAASMAGILLQAGDVRVMGAESYLLIHETSFGAGGKIGEVEDTMAFIKKIEERALSIFAARSTLSKAQLRTRWKRKDWWMDSTEALKLGFCDEVR